MTQIFTFPEQIWSRGSVGESRDDGLFSGSTSGGDGRATQAGVCPLTCALSYAQADGLEPVFVKNIVK